MSIRLQFFSGNTDETNNNSSIEQGYDGSMFVETFNTSDLPKLLASMDCVYGDCIVIATVKGAFGPGRDQVNAYKTVRTHEQ